MPKKKRSAAEDSVRVTKGAPQDPMQKMTKAGGKRAVTGKEGDEVFAPTDRPQCTGSKPNGQRCKRPPVRGGDRCQMHGGNAGKRTNAAKRDAVKVALDRKQKVSCTAKKRNGERCSNPPLRGTTVCRMHGGGAPQVKAKANQRLIEMVLPAMRELHRILDSKTASDADKLKAIHMVLQRTGFHDRHQIDIGLREPTPWDTLDHTAFQIVRGVENIVHDAELPHPQREAIGPGQDDDDAALTAFLEQRERQREREASTKLDNRDHEVIPGDVISDRDADLFGFPQTSAQRHARSGRPSEHDPAPHRPEEKPWAAYERDIRSRVEGRE